MNTSPEKKAPKILPRKHHSVDTKLRALKTYYNPSSRAFGSYEATAQMHGMHGFNVRNWNDAFKNGTLRLPELSAFIYELKKEGKYTEPKVRRDSKRAKKTAPSAPHPSTLAKVAPMAQRKAVKVEKKLADIANNPHFTPDPDPQIERLQAKLNGLSRENRRLRHKISDLTRCMRGMAQHLK